MKVKEILKSKGSKVWSVKSHETIKDAVCILVLQKIGALLVHDRNEDIVGIVTERDVMRACHEYGNQVTDVVISKIMTKNVIIGDPEDDLDYIMNIMTKNRLRHVPIVENGEIKGIVSIGDVVKALLHDSQIQIRYLKDFIHGHQSES